MIIHFKCTRLICTYKCKQRQTTESGRNAQQIQKKKKDANERERERELNKMGKKNNEK